MPKNELAEPGRCVEWRFTNRAGYDSGWGKAGYPACLLLRLDKRDALELAEALVRFGRSRDPDGPATHDFAFYGTLEREGTESTTLATEAARELATLRQQLAAAYAALERYGQHDLECATQGGYNGETALAVCSCGLDAALEGK